MTPSGTTSVADDLVLTTTGIPTFKSCITFYSATLGLPVPFYDGRRCLYAPFQRLPLMNSGAAGTIAYGPGLAASEVSWRGPRSASRPGTATRQGPCEPRPTSRARSKVAFTP